jgi:hypothetical protein
MSAAKPIPTRANVIEITSMHAPKNCKRCGDPANYYVFVTDTEANGELDTDLDADGWPFNEFLCEDCFSDGDAERTHDWSELV